MNVLSLPLPIRKLYFRWVVWRNIDDHIKRRTRVEKHLWKVVEGKAEPPDADKCRELALELGIPTRYREG